MARGILLFGCILKAMALVDINTRQLPVLDCDQWGGDCSQCSHCKKSHASWNCEWWYYAIVPHADTTDHGDLHNTVDEKVTYVRALAQYSAQNITNKHTLAGYKPSRVWPGINTSEPVQFFSGIQIHACVPIRGCYSILYQLGANYTSNDTHYRHWSDDIYISNDTFKVKIPCGSFYNYNYATGNFDAPCIDMELHYSADLASQPKQTLLDAITDPTLALKAANMAFFPESLGAKVHGNVKISNYKMPSDGYYGHGETVALADFREASGFHAYYGHAFGERSGYNSGITNWLWLYAQNMTCAEAKACDFGDSLDVWVGGQFGPADFIYIDGEALRGETFVAIDFPAQSDAKAVTLPDGTKAIQIKQRMHSTSHDGEFQFYCPAHRITPYSANKFTMHAALCPSQIQMRRRSDPEQKTSTYRTSLGFVELDVVWLSKVGLLNETGSGPYPMVPYPAQELALLV